MENLELQLEVWRLGRAIHVLFLSITLELGINENKNNTNKPTTENTLFGK